MRQSLTEAEQRAKHAAAERARRKANPEHCRAIARAWEERNKEKRLAYARARYAKNPKKACATVRAYRLRYEGSYRARARIRHLKSSYGLTRDDAAGLFKQAKWRCQICQWPFGKNDSFAHIDHNHQTGHPRGVLCKACNLGLGYYKDNVELLQQAIKYLQVSAAGGTDQKAGLSSIELSPVCELRE